MPEQRAWGIEEFTDMAAEVVAGMRHTCSLDVDESGMTLEEIGNAMGVTRERIRQMLFLAQDAFNRAKIGRL